MVDEQTQYQISELIRRLNSMIKVGRIIEVDAANYRARADLGNDTETAALPWLARAGDMSAWIPPTVGEGCLVLSPSGHLEVGYIIPGIYNSDNPPASNDLSETLVKWGSDYVSRNASGVTVKAPTVVIDGNLEVTGNMSVNGTLDVLQTISSQLDVVAGAISLLLHSHPFPDPSNPSKTLPPTP